MACNYKEHLFHFWITAYARTNTLRLLYCYLNTAVLGKVQIAFRFPQSNKSNRQWSRQFSKTWTELHVTVIYFDHQFHHVCSEVCKYICWRAGRTAYCCPRTQGSDWMNILWSCAFHRRYKYLYIYKSLIKYQIFWAFNDKTRLVKVV